MAAAIVAVSNQRFVLSLLASCSWRLWCSRMSVRSVSSLRRSRPMSAILSPKSCWPSRAMLTRIAYIGVTTVDKEGEWPRGDSGDGYGDLTNGGRR